MALRGVGRLRLLTIAVGASAALSTIAMSASPVDAHPWRQAHRHAHYVQRYHANYARRPATPADPAFAAIVVDANTGRTLYSVNENEPRHPASITKVMTLYLLFEQLDKGALTLQSQIPISEHAAAQEPSKLGLEPGDTISVENAIKAIVTRSANDIAVAVAEAVGHDESSFAAMMTRKAHALGMSRTVYVNASGLPNDQQITTAHDLTILGRATEERFPRYFKYFSTHEFEYAGEMIGNHNHLLGRVDGVDGIKTGYTRASGFNLLTSVHRDGRSLVAVVMGGRSAGSRDATMESLIATHIAEASDRGHTATMIADADAGQSVGVPAAAGPISGRTGVPLVAANVPAPPERPAASRLEDGDAGATEAAAIPPADAPTSNRPSLSLVAANAPAPPTRPGALRVEEGDAEDDEDGAPRVAAVLPPAKIAQRIAVAAPSNPAELAPAAAPLPAPAAHVQQPPTPAELGWVKGPDSVVPQAKSDSIAKPEATARPQLLAKAEPIAKPEPTKAAPAPIPPAARAREETAVARIEEARGDNHSGWIIQIGATDDAAKANDLLARAREKDRAALASATPLTEKVQRGDDVFYRARFAGLDSASAELACRSLKKSGFPCFATHD
jgi:D-alanyl-D-alanine carboxypeptidase